jgi:hypothetical protein
MSEQAKAGKETFRRTTFEEQMLATALGNLCSESTDGLDKKLELVLEVYLTSLEKSHFKVEESFSQG